MSGHVAISGAVTLFDHIVVVPRLEATSSTVFVAPVGDEPGHVLFGGCGCNQAVAAAKLGVDVDLYGVVGDDFVTSGYAPYLEQLGVGTDSATVIKGAASGHSYLIHDEDGSTFLIVEEGIATRGRPIDIVSPDVVPGTTVALLNMPFDDLALALAASARTAGAAVILVGQLATTDKATRLSLLQLATYVSCNAGEADAIGLLDRRSETRRVARNLEGVWVTRGASGISYESVDGETFTVPSVPVERIVEPTGAGDAAAAGIATALTLGADVREVTEIAAVTASFALESFGCQDSLPTRARLAERFEQAFGRPPGCIT